MSLFFIETGQFVAYAHEGGGLNVASLQDDGQDIVKIPTSVSFCFVFLNLNLFICKSSMFL